MSDVGEPRKAKSRSKVRYAVVGLGYIAQIAVLPAFAHAKRNSELTALVSGDPEKLKALSERYGVENLYSYEEYSECLKRVDAVYIALPNHMHRAYTVGAAESGVHVLCEKPMAMEAADCEAMIAATRDARVKLMIAYRLHFELGNLSSIDAIASGQIGEPRIFSSVFSQQVKEGNSRLRKDVGGGAIYDMGIYCINAARYLFKEEPTEVFAWNGRTSDPRFAEVPEMTTALMRFPGDRIAQFTASFGSTDRSAYEVIGTRGVLKMDPAYELAETLRSELTVDGSSTKKAFKKRDQFAPELIYFSDCVLNDREPEPSGEEGLADVRIIEAILASAEKKQPVSLSATHVGRRPDMSQEISKPAISSPPELVRAAAPGAD